MFKIKISAALSSDIDPFFSPYQCSAQVGSMFAALFFFRQKASARHPTIQSN